MFSGKLPQIKQGMKPDWELYTLFFLCILLANMYRIFLEHKLIIIKPLKPFIIKKNIPATFLTDLQEVSQLFLCN